MLDFIKLNSFVIEYTGLDPNSLISQLVNIEITAREFDNPKKIQKTPEGIFYIDEKGKKHKGFVYLKAGRNLKVAIEKGYSNIPKFHISNCATIVKKKLEEDYESYIFTQKEVSAMINEVPAYFDFKNRVMKINENFGGYEEIEICGYCLKNNSQGIRSNLTTKQYVEQFILNNAVTEGSFNDEEKPNYIDRDADGYTLDWAKVSEEFRKVHNWTCQECGINLSKPDSHQYCDTHHINNRKRNNNKYNLKCLCVLCHANQDEYHRQNFSVGINNSRLKEFISRYFDELKRIKNPHIH